MSNPEEYMSYALTLAARGRLTVSPNPMVGCVIVKDQAIIGTGYHQMAGGPHAEIIALQQAGKLAKDATLYVTLEPCCHYNRTPPCTDAIIAAGIKTVVIPSLDPNPKVSGKGVQALEAAGIRVQMGLKEVDAIKLNEIFFYYMQTQRPFVIAKWAMSLDGKTITHQNDSRDISSSASRAHSHLTRQQVDAILIGAQTAITDDPLLTTRHTETNIIKHPIRIILSSKGDLPLHLKLLNDPTSRTIVATTNAISKKMREILLKKNIEVLIINQNADQQIDLNLLLKILGERGITSLLVEGGNQVRDNFFLLNLVNRVHVYLAPTVIANLQQKKWLTNIQLNAIDHDYFFSGDNENV